MKRAGKFKNLAVIILMLVAVLQINILWFDKISDHNFFCWFYNTQNPTQDDSMSENNSLAENFKMIVKQDQGFCIVYKPSMKQKQISDSFIRQILDNGKFILEDITQDNFFMTEIYNAVCVYDYDFFISNQDFCSCYQKKISNISQAELFNKIFFYDTNEVIFFNSDLNKIYKYALKNKSGSSIPMKQFNLISKDIYSYDRQNNFFYPSYIHKIKATNPYAENSELLMNTVSSKLANFFDNPATKNVENINNIFTFSNGFVSVKYLPNNILEYKNYRSQEKGSSLALDYLAATNFIKNDPYIKNDFILKSYERKDNQYEFYFDYYINNMPLELDKSFLQKNTIRSFIHVTVKNSLVINYEKITFNFGIDSNVIDNKLRHYHKYIFDGALLFQK